MKTYTVYMLTPYMGWDDVKAKSKAEAIKKCQSDPETDTYDANDGPAVFVAVEDER